MDDGAYGLWPLAVLNRALLTGFAGSRFPRLRATGPRSSFGGPFGPTQVVPGGPNLVQTVDVHAPGGSPPCNRYRVSPY